MFRSTSNFDKLLDKATSNFLLEPDWVTIIQLCDLIRQNDVQPKYAIAAIKKKLYSQNPHCALYALQVFESIVKNCGATIHNEVAAKETCEMFHELAKTTPHESVREKVLELIQGWAFAFRKKPKYRAVLDIVNIMKAEGYKFPQLNESDAMFLSDSAPEWADGVCCHRCRTVFSLVQRKHHCRACGQVFCGQCSQHTATLPKFGIEKEVRVCDGCWAELMKPGGPGGATPVPVKKESELPVEYVNSSLAQQSQTPPRKTEEELREEEELNLALALSQSEAEAKKEVAVVAAPIPEDDNPELARYLNRSYWEQKSPSAPTAHAATLAQQPLAQTPVPLAPAQQEMEEFIDALKSQVEIFVNRMKSNSSRGRSIAVDSSVQTLFMNITAMHSRLLRFIQQQDDARLRYEAQQDKLSQIKDARAALDALREEHQERLRRERDEAERVRQMQMAHKLEIMRKKKQEYLQYQRQLALQRIQEEEREMQMRQEQQKQQYYYGQYGQVYPIMMGPTGLPIPQQGMPPQGVAPPQAFAPGMAPQGMPPQQGLPPGVVPHGMAPPQGMPPGMAPQQGMPPGMAPQGMPPQGIPPPQAIPQGMIPQQGMHIQPTSPPAVPAPQPNPHGGVPPTESNQTAELISFD